MQIQLTLDERLIADITRCLDRQQRASAAAITFEALALFNWAAKRRRQGLVLVSADEFGPTERVTTPLLEGCAGLLALRCPPLKPGVAIPCRSVQH